MNYQNNCDNEFSLREFIIVVLKRKKVIFSIFLFFMVVAIIMSLLAPPRYQVKAIIQNGVSEYTNTLGEVSQKPLASVEEISVITRSSDFLTPLLKKVGLKVSPYELEEFAKESIKIEPIEDTNFFLLKVTLEDKGKAYSLVREIIAAYNNYMEQSLRTLRNSFPNFVLTKEFKTIEQPLIPERPVVSDAGFTFTIFAILGLIAGTVIAFFQEFWEREGLGKIKETKKNKKGS